MYTRLKPVGGAKAELPELAGVVVALGRVGVATLVIGVRVGLLCGAVAIDVAVGRLVDVTTEVVMAEVGELLLKNEAVALVG